MCVTQILTQCMHFSVFNSHEDTYRSGSTHSNSSQTLYTSSISTHDTVHGNFHCCSNVVFSFLFLVFVVFLVASLSNNCHPYFIGPISIIWFSVYSFRIDLLHILDLILKWWLFVWVISLVMGKLVPGLAIVMKRQIWVWFLS